MAPKNSKQKAAPAARKKPAKKTAPRRHAVAATAKQAAKTQKEAVQKTAHNTQQATRKVEKAMTQTQKQAQAQYEKMAQQASTMGKDQWEAMMKSGNIWMKGCEDLMQTCMNLAQDNAEKSSQAMKNLMSCKTLNEMTETQNKLIQQGFDDFMKDTKKLSEMTVKLTTEAFEPLNDQMTKSVRKATEGLAA